MAFYHIMNCGFDLDQLQDRMNRSFQKKDGVSSADELFKKIRAMYSEDKLQQLWPQMEQAEQLLKESIKEREGRMDVMGFGRRPRLPSPMVAYCPDAPWLPFFDEDICEGYNASSKDALRLSKAFQAPVLAFSIFDSDILMLSYGDAAKNLAYDYAKPNCQGMEEYDTGLFQTAFPQFLLELCPQAEEKRLREIWDGEEVFADNRMEKLSEILGTVPLYSAVPEGFEAITPQ